MSHRGREIEVVTQGVIPSLPDIEPPTLTLPHEGGGNWTTLTLPHRWGWNWAEADGEFIESLDRTVGGLEQLGRKRQRAPVVRPSHQGIADCARLIALGQEVAQCGKILEALRHLLAHRVLQVLGVQPVAGERLSGRRLALGNLVLVVGKNVVDASGVDVETLPQVLHAHRGALDVPAGAACSERRIPRLLPRLACLP